MTKKRKEDGFNLAFLDVMACGLGAVLMILIVLKFSANTPVPSDEIERLTQELASIDDQASQVKKTIDEVNDNIAQESASIDAIKQQINDLLVLQQAAAKAVDEQQAVVADLQESIAAAAPKQSDDLLTTPGTGEENYLLGLKVEGKRIVILLDTSASMTDENLIDILKRKVQSDKVKQLGPKWQRTKRIVMWMLARLPKDARVTVVSFNQQASILGGKAGIPASDSNALKALVSDIDTLVPSKGTNLQVALQEAKRAEPNMSTLYLITDGLPTLLSSGSGFNSNRNCKPSDPTQKTISGDCRFSVFQHTFARFAPRTETNIVLLPLEGDTQAPSAYWNWANITGGLMISPASTWP
jgi:uncharacterized coiled-coil protein SlyX